MSLIIPDVSLFCAYTVFTEPRDDTAFYSSNNDITGSVEIGHLPFVLVLTLMPLNVPKHDIMLAWD